MNTRPSRPRRAFLAGAAGTFAATSGCVGEVRNLVGREQPTQLSLTISTLPVSNDPYAVRIANRLAENLEASGIETAVEPVPADVLLRDILVNHDYDIYVARYPSQGQPDELRSMLYSTYAEEPGWQNPFGFSDLTFDDLLDEQRIVNEEMRPETVHEIQRQIIEEQPFTVVCDPDFLGAVRDDRFDGWSASGLIQPLDYFQLDRVGSETSLNLLLRNERITRNRNPIAAEHRDQGHIVGLLYDPLIRTPPNSSDIVNWLAESIIWEDAPTLSATIELRETPWHDGEAVSAHDVAFTYEFLRDTSLGEFDTPAPTPWRRGRISLVNSIEAASDRHVRIDFTTRNRSVAYRALMVPILPEHIWRERSNAADIAGIEIAGQTTEALVNSNEAAIGSGPLQFVDSEIDQSLSLEVFPEHFLYTDRTEGIPDRFLPDDVFDRIEFTVAPSHDAAVQILTDDGADATADGLQASVVPRVLRATDLSLTVRQIEPFYHIGYNCRRSPLTDPNFRRVVARHIDREATVSTSLDSYGVPSEAPLSGEWIPTELQWDGEATLSFLGADDTFDPEAAREAFQEAGYQYRDDALIRRSGT